ncbi:MAG: hypothetical protein KGO48_16915 [Alphaproteobacteria bacterium]|nr:hypothetical protein [Alphaproteobacteria bacterium]
MRSVEYRELAQQCRRIASSLKGDIRAQLLEVAASWDRLADDSEKRNGSHFRSAWKLSSGLE